MEVVRKTTRAGRRFATAAVLAWCIVLDGCAQPTYTNSRDVTFIEDVNVLSMSATNGGVWFYDESRTIDQSRPYGGVTIGFIASSGHVTLLPVATRNFGPYVGDYNFQSSQILAASRSVAYVTLLDFQLEGPPSSVGIATVRDGKMSAPVTKKGLESLGGLALVRGTLFVGESSRSLGELRHGAIADHAMPPDSGAPLDTMVIAADGAGDVFVADGKTNRLAEFSTKSRSWQRFQKVRGLAAITALATVGDALWALGGSRLMRISLSSGSDMQVQLAHRASRLATMPDGTACANSPDEALLMCATPAGKASDVKLPLNYPARSLSSSGSKMWYGIPDLPSNAFFGHSHWGSAIGSIDRM